MLKLQYIASAAPTCWNIIDVPEPYNEKLHSGDQWKDAAAWNAYNDALQLAKEKCIPIHKEDQAEVDILIYRLIKSFDFKY